MLYRAGQFKADCAARIYGSLVTLHERFCHIKAGVPDTELFADIRCEFRLLDDAVNGAEQFCLLPADSCFYILSRLLGNDFQYVTDDVHIEGILNDKNVTEAELDFIVGLDADLFQIKRLFDGDNANFAGYSELRKALKDFYDKWNDVGFSAASPLNIK